MIVITGIGVRTPLGNQVPQTAASWRAGLTRIAHARFQLGPVADVPGAGGDRPWTDKALGLLAPAAHEAVERAGLSTLPAQGQRPHIQVYVGCPSPQRAGISLEDCESFVEDLRDVGILPFEPSRVDVVTLDHAAGLLCLAHAFHHLTERKTDIAIVCGVDSFLSAEYLAHLAETGRLKTEEQPSGLIPGEGAAVLVLERSTDVSARKGPRPLAQVEAVAMEKEETPIGPEHPLEAVALSHVVRSALGQSAPKIAHIFADLNGERWRFLEWGLTEARCLEAIPHGWKLHHPADSMGDLGAAAPLVSAALYARGGERGYLHGSCLITAASLSGERAAVRLSLPS